MKDSRETDEPLCMRAEDLVAYLYNEASADEARDFERHTEHCASCKAELVAFGQVRSSIAEWRGHALGLAETKALSNAIKPAQEGWPAQAHSDNHVRRPSALAAFREFFALSPVWMRAATGLAGLAICALIVFAAARMTESPRVVYVEKNVPVSPSQAVVDALVERRVREELASRKNSGEMNPGPSTMQVKEQINPTLAQSAGRSGSAQRRAATQNRRTRAPVPTEEYEELARDLQLVPTRDEEDLPRLIDLMDEAN